MLEHTRKFKEPLYRDLANGRFRGDKLENLLAVYPPDLILHHLPYTTLVYADGQPQGARTCIHVVARNGRLIRASGASCTWWVTFFNGLTDEERKAWYEGYDVAFCAHYNLPPRAPAAPAAPEPEVAPKPRAIPDDSRWRSRQEYFRTGNEPVLRGLALCEIKVGDPIEPLIKRHPNYTVLRNDTHTFLHKDDGYGGTLLAARDGKLILARTSSCIYCDTFFDEMTDKERGDCWNAFAAARQARIDRIAPWPRAVDTKP